MSQEQEKITTYVLETIMREDRKERDTSGSKHEENNKDENEENSTYMRKISHEKTNPIRTKTSEINNEEHSSR